MAYHRIDLATRNGDATLTLYLPLGADGHHDESAPVPNLVKAHDKAARESYHGAVDEDGVITWDEFPYVSRTDIFAAPIRQQRQVVVPAFYDQEREAVFVVGGIYPPLDRL